MTTSSTTNGELAKPHVGTFASGIGRHVARPHDGAVIGVERVQDSGRTKCVDATVAEGRRRARTGTAIRLPEPGRVAVSPHRLAGGHVVAGDDLVVAALLLGVEEVAADREGRPARSDRPAPQLDRRRRGPVGLDPHAANDAVALGSAKAGPVGFCLRGGRSRDVLAAGRRRGCGRLVAGSCRERLLGSLRCSGSRRERLGPRRAESSGSSPAWARSRSSAVFVHRHAKSEPRAGDRLRSGPASTLRTRAGWSRPSTRAEVRSERRRLATAQATKARLRTGMA